MEVSFDLHLEILLRGEYEKHSCEKIHAMSINEGRSIAIIFFPRNYLWNNRLNVSTICFTIPF